jgi:16S rRNA (cytidine1402-2'-O)-methyltransferase
MLYICATPIGNLGDVTLRVLEVLKKVDLVACEDTRRTRILLDRYAISARLLSFHDHNEELRAQTLLPLLREGKEIALVTDAGMPGLSDPGFTLVRTCVDEGVSVTVLPGPSAIATAVVISGLPTAHFAFIGFLARSQANLVQQVASCDGTGSAVVAFESPRRLRKSLETLGARWPKRRLAVCRELTKVHEEVLRGTADEVLSRLDDQVRGEIVIVLEPNGGGRAASPMVGPEHNKDLDQRTRGVLAELLAMGVGTKRAAGMVSELTGLPARATYRLALEAKTGREIAETH